MIDLPSSASDSNNKPHLDDSWLSGISKILDSKKQKNKRENATQQSAPKRFGKDSSLESLDRIQRGGKQDLMAKGGDVFVKEESGERVINGIESKKRKHNLISPDGSEDSADYPLPLSAPSESLFASKSNKKAKREKKEMEEKEKKRERKRLKRQEMKKKEKEDKREKEVTEKNNKSEKNIKQEKKEFGKSKIKQEEDGEEEDEDEGEDDEEEDDGDDEEEEEEEEEDVKYSAKAKDYEVVNSDDEERAIKKEIKTKYSKSQREFIDESALEYGAFDFTDVRPVPLYLKKKGTTIMTLEQRIRKAERREKALAQDTESAKAIRDSFKWKKVLDKAKGLKPTETASKLKETLKKSKKRKQKSREEWAKRLQEQQERKEEKQKKRDRNLKKRKEAKLENKINKRFGIKKSKTKLRRPGFEGRKRNFINK